MTWLLAGSPPYLISTGPTMKASGSTCCLMELAGANSPLSRFGSYLPASLMMGTVRSHRFSRERSS